MNEFDRITRTPGVMDGKARIRGRRVTVATVVGQVAAGYSFDEILVSYPYLEREDIRQALSYAASLAAQREVVLAEA
jgi:uncharacterized protein (DUF433 family)